MRSRALLVDADNSTRGLLRTALESRADFEVIGEAATSSAGAAAAEAEQPDVIVVDHDMPDQCAIDVVLTLHAAAPRARIVLWSAEVDVTDERALDAIDDVAEKTATVDQVLAAMVGPR